MIKKNIHFICKGNVFRSRLAEAYLNSLKLDLLEASSSGTEANLDTDGPIGWYASRIIKKNNLVKYLKPYWNQTTRDVLNSSDHIVFMMKDHYINARDKHDFLGRNYEVWNIKDMGDYGFTSDDMGEEEEINSIKVSEKIFKSIVDNINSFIKKRIVSF